MKDIHRIVFRLEKFLILFLYGISMKFGIDNPSFWLCLFMLCLIMYKFEESIRKEDDDTIIRFMSRPIQEIFIDENAKGQVDTILRSFEWDTRKLIQKFGEEVVLEALNAPEVTQIKDRQHKIIHAVMPREDAERAGLGSKSFPFASA